MALYLLQKVVELSLESSYPKLYNACLFTRISLLLRNQQTIGIYEDWMGKKGRHRHTGGQLSNLYIWLHAEAKVMLQANKANLLGAGH